MVFHAQPELKAASANGQLYQGAGHGGRARSLRGRSCRDLLAAVSGGQPALEVLSLDIFDTALLRLVRKPADAFLFLTPAVCREVAAGADLPFGDLRAAAERTARARKFAAARHQEVTLPEIYDVFCELAGVDASLHKDRLMESELGVEASLLYPNPAVLAAAVAAERAGTRVVFVSDMYLPPGFITSQLRRAGYPVDKGALFLSSDHRVSKHEGELFDRMLGVCGCAPDQVVHVGDNFHSDVERAAERGIKTIHWEVNAAARDSLVQFGPREDDAPPSVFAGDDLLSSLCAGLARRSRLAPAAARAKHAGLPAGTAADDALWDRLGYEVGGPLYLTFLSWLLRQARLEGRRRLFFLARDGHYLRQACDLLTANAGLEIVAVDMAASRRLLNLAQITSFDQAAWQFLLTPNPHLSVRHFLTRLGLEPESLRDAIRQAGFASMDDVITTPGGVFCSEADHRAMHTLFLSLEPVVLAQAAAERGRLQRYFEQIRFVPGETDKSAVIDLGWQASSARSLQTLLNLRSYETGHPRGTLRAFYFGTWHLARSALEVGCDLSSFFFHLDKPAQRCALIAESVELIELFFGAPHPTIIGLREDAGGRIEPLYGEHEHGETHRRCVARMRERAVEFVREVVAVDTAGDFLNWGGSGVNHLEAILKRILRRPSLHEARTLGSLLARDSFGGSSPGRSIARPPGRVERWLRPARLRQTYQHAFWKRGFLAQFSPREAARVQIPG